MNAEGNMPGLEEVFSPRSIAIVGISGSGRMGFTEIVLLALKEAGYSTVYPVNSKYDSIFDVPCYNSLSETPDPVDHVIVAIPSGSVLRLLDECGEKGVRSVHFFTAGFRESGYKEKADLELEMLKRAQRWGFRIIGPNCVGLYVPKQKVINFLGMPFDSGSIAFISQSGGHASNLPFFSANRGLRYSKVVSYGNALDVDEIELLEYLADDDETDIIGAYIEGVRQGKRFFNALKNAASRKPVIVYKGGRTEAGQRAAQGHTASMVSSIDVFRAVCSQSNAMWVENIEELQDQIVALKYCQKIPRGKKTALFGSGGGPTVLAGDEIESMGLEIPQFSESFQEELKTVLPVDGGIFKNPLDTVNLAEIDGIKPALEKLCNNPEIDMIVYHLGFHPIGMWGIGRFSEKEYLKKLISVFNAARDKTDKTIMIALRPVQQMTGMEEFLAVQEQFVENGFPVFYSLEKMALAMNRMIDWNRRKKARG